MNISTVGLDLAKNVFQVHDVDELGRPVLRKTLRRAEMASFFARLSPCLIGMEACAGAHFWARIEVPDCGDADLGEGVFNGRGGEKQNDC